MHKKTDIEMQRLRLAKISRSLLRLKHSLNADVEINDTLPDLLVDFDKGLQSGELRTLPADFVNEVLDS